MITIAHRLKAATLLLSCLVVPLFTQAQTEYPRPTSEYSEETAPGTQVLLSYPKYYINAEGKLVLVNTTIVPSLDPAYDYEVIQGIYHFKVRKDGTFMVEHEGDVFTYRFNSLGTGRGSGFKPFELGEADFSRFIVTGDTIRWSDVYKDIDLSVRYIHDILKVDVIVKNAFMTDLKAEAKAGKLNKNDYLTARFDIPQVLLTSKAKQNGMDKDLYAEALDVEQPISFEKNGKVVHLLRQVETYLLDGNGYPIYDQEKPIRSAQIWNLKPNAPGVAEMSAWIGDLVDLPEGDVALDPSVIFQPSYKDTRLASTSADSNYGTSTTFNWQIGNLYGTVNNDRLLFSFDLPSASANIVINQATLEIYALTQSWIGANAKAQAHRVVSTWVETSATYNNANTNYDQDSSSPWVTLPTSGNNWMKFDVTQIMRTHLRNNYSDVKDKGFHLKGDTSTTGVYSIASNNYTIDTNLRPKLIINHDFAEFGIDAGSAWDSESNTNQQRVVADHFNLIRFFAHDQSFTVIKDFMSKANNNKLKVLLNFRCGPVRNVTSEPFDRLNHFYGFWDDDAGTFARTPAGYADWVAKIINSVSDHVDGRTSRTIVGVEFGNEEDRWFDG